MSSPLDPLQLPRVEPVVAQHRAVRRKEAKDDADRRRHSDEPFDEGEEPEDDGLHVDVLA
jgi:hypothetical protein